MMCIALFIAALSAGDSGTARVFSVEAHRRVLGYSVEQSRLSEWEGKPVRLFSARTVLQTGPEVEGRFGGTIREERYWVDAESDRVLKAQLTLRQGKAFEIKEAEFIGDKVAFRVFSHEGERDSGELDLPEGTVVAYRAEVPVKIAMNRGPGAMKLFVMSRLAVRDVELRRGKDETLSFEGVEHECHRWVVESDDRDVQSTMWVTAGGELVKLEKTAEGLTFQPAPKEVAGRLARAAKPRESVKTDSSDPRSLTFMVAQAVIRCPGVKDAAQLTTGNQAFYGTVEEGKVEGTFRVRSVQHDVRPELPVAAGPEMERWFAVDREVPGIAEMAEETVKGLEQRWHAAHALGIKVRQAVRFEPSGPDDPREALEKGRAGSKGMTELHVLLCRSLGIPARAAIGVVLGFDGAFRELWWSEVHMGDAGWLSMDTALGELTFLDAAHIRLGLEGPCEVVEAGVRQRIPLPEKERPRVETIKKPFPIDEGETHVYAYFIKDELQGTEKVRFLGGEDSLFLFESDVDLKNLKGRTVTLAGFDGRLRSFEADYGKVTCTCRREGGEALCEVKSEEAVNKEAVFLPREGLFFDSYQIMHLGLLLSRLTIEPGDVVQLGVFHPSGMRVITFQVEHKGRRGIEVKGVTQEVNVIDLLGGSKRLTVHITDAGLILEELESGGKVKVVWQGLED